MRRSSASGPQQVAPWKTMRPERSALSGSRLRMDMAVTLARARLAHQGDRGVLGMSKLTPRTAQLALGIRHRSAWPMRKATVQVLNAQQHRLLIRARAVWDRARRAARR